MTTMANHTHGPNHAHTQGRTDEPDLTARYVHAATRGLDEDQRDDVALELRAGVADRVDSLRAADPSLAPEAAEYAALTELGDPDRLAASYTGALRHLIGPDLYGIYRRVLRVTLLSVVPAVTAIVAVVEIFQGAGFGGIIGSTAWTAFNASVHIAFWVTLSFAILERTAAPTEESLGLEPWSPEKLPSIPRASRAALGETITNITFLAIMGGAIAWQQVTSPVHVDGERIPVLDPDLWSFWLPVVLVALALEAVFEVVKYRAGGRWTREFAAVNTLVGALLAAPLAWLAFDDRLLNPAFTTFAQSHWAEFDPQVTHLLVAVSAVAIWLWDTVDGWRKAL